MDGLALTASIHYRRLSKSRIKKIFMIIQVLGRSLDFVGSEKDRYFSLLQTFAQDVDKFVNVASRLRDDAIIFDVGANIGLISTVFAIVKPSAKIVAFEPSPANARFLRENIKIFGNVEVVEAAVTHEEGRLSFHEANFGAGSHVVNGNHMAPWTAMIDVPTIRLDDYSAMSGLHPDLIKIDAEGHEPEVLAGARNVIENSKPYILMELNAYTLNTMGGHSPAAFVKALWHAFDVETENNKEYQAMEFLHNHLIKEHCMTDLVMKLKADAKMPSFEEMSFSPAAREAIEQARRVKGSIGSEAR